MNSLPKMMDRVSKDFSVTTETITVSGRKFNILRPDSPEDILDEETLLRAHDELPWQPYWAQAWESAYGMMEFLLEQDVAGKTLLDVGCGLGLTSAAALHQGAHVVLGDNAPPALLFARINTWPWRDRATVIELDWHTTRLPQKFDWIIGSDILYDRKDIASLDQYFRHHLAAEGKIFLSDPSRAMTKDFLKELERLHWSIDISTQPNAGNRPIRIIELVPQL